MNRIKINKLTARSAEKDYSISFKNGLNIISGESMTGKTSILELINFCFGESEHPQTQEFRKLLVAFLEVEINQEYFTIERQLFSKRKTANIHFCQIDQIGADHKSIEVGVSQKVNEESISSFILSQIGLKGIQLKEAPKQEASGTDTLSFRDLLWLCYLKRSRVGGEKLLFENEFMKYHKLVQVVDVVFDLYSNISAVLGAELDSIQGQIEENERTEKTLLDFLNSQGILTSDKLEEEKNKLTLETSSLKARLSGIDKDLTGSSDIAKGLRKEVLGLEAVLQKKRMERRSFEKNLLRLLPLRSQYYEDISKLNFLNQAKQIFDPLLIVRCPVCLSPLEKESGPTDYCPLCRRKIAIDDSESKVDVTKEISTIKRKLDELNRYIEEIEGRLKENEKEDKTTADKLSFLSKDLDDSLKSFVAPYLTERDELVSRISDDENRIKNIEEFVNFRNQIKAIEEEIIRLKIKEERINKSLQEERAKSLIRIELIKSLSETYYRQLQTVHFPKLAEAHIDDNLIPYVKGLKYHQLSSEGAINLSSICWMTTIFDEAIRRLAHHPGFLIIDYVQSGIGIGPNVKEEFQDVSIVRGLYDLLLEVSTLDGECQLIAVDNHPPEYVKGYVIVYFSRNPNKPPYGFIYDETS